MLTFSRSLHQPGLLETDLLLQLDPTDPLLQLALEISWHEFDEAFSILLQQCDRRAEQADPVDGRVVDTKAIAKFE